MKTEKTFAYRQQIALGRALAKQLKPVMTLQQCADKLGTSYQYVQKMEALALGKVATAMKEFVALEQIEL